MEGILALILLFVLYFIPTWIAIKKQHSNKTAIILINLLAGWMILGWFIALIWAIKKPENQQDNLNTADEIEKLHNLKEKGIISEAEFESKKRKIL